MAFKVFIEISSDFRNIIGIKISSHRFLNILIEKLYLIYQILGCW